MERSFAKEIESLTLGEGEVFHGEGILAVTKALLQSGVSYVGGYQGAPVSHLIDVMVQAAPRMAALGVHVEPCTNEASAAAMLGASIMYPVRGAVTWKSIVGTNVAADALSNLASPGVTGGTLIVVGEDYGDGASVIQERTHAYAMKSAIWLMDPRPDLETIVRCAESAFELSEASNTPVMLELRIRACHVQGSFVARDNVAPKVSMKEVLAEPAPHRYDHLAHPPATFAHEKRKYDERMPAARECIREAGPQRSVRGDGARRAARGRRDHRAGRGPQRADAGAARAGSGRRRREHRPANPRPERRLPARARGDPGLRQGQVGAAGGRGRAAGVHRARDRLDPAPRGRAGGAVGQGRAAHGRRVPFGSAHGRGLRLSAQASARGGQHAGQRRLRGGGRGAEGHGQAPSRGVGSAAPARVLHRLPGSVPSSPRSSWRSGRSARCTIRRTSAAMPSRPSLRSTTATRSSATG